MRLHFAMGDVEVANIEVLRAQSSVVGTRGSASANNDGIRHSVHVQLKGATKTLISRWMRCDRRVFFEQPL